MEQSNLISKVEISADLSDTLNEGYKDAIQKPLQSSSKAVTILMDFFNNTILYPMQKYNLYAESKLNNFAYELKNKASKIPNENLIEPQINILGPTIEGLKYNLDEEHIKEMFTNILLSNMDNRKQGKVHPSFIEVVKQLSCEDANDLKFLKEKNKTDLPIMNVKYKLTTSEFIFPTKNIFLIHEDDVYDSDALVINNLVRLNLIEIDYTHCLTDEYIYEQGFNKIKPYFDIPEGYDIKELGYDKGILRFTQYGKDFIDICLS